METRNDIIVLKRGYNVNNYIVRGDFSNLIRSVPKGATCSILYTDNNGTLISSDKCRSIPSSDSFSDAMQGVTIDNKGKVIPTCIIPPYVVHAGIYILKFNNSIKDPAYVQQDPVHATCLDSPCCLGRYPGPVDISFALHEDRTKGKYFSQGCVVVDKQTYESVRRSFPYYIQLNIQ